MQAGTGDRSRERERERGKAGGAASIPQKEKLGKANRRKDGQLKIGLERRIKQKWIRQVCARRACVRAVQCMCVYMC